MPANYDNSAWFYDRLSRLVYGDALVRAQVYLLGFIPANAKVLIAGGGTGWILEKLANLHPAGLQITYSEISAKMMARAKKKHTGSNAVAFVNEAVENLTLPPGFDVVITPFLFDSFTMQSAELMFKHIDSLLKPAGRWLYADFQPTGKWRQKILLKSMLLFFKALCGIESSNLPDVESLFKLNGYATTAQQTFLNDFVISKVYARK
jgi:ubiquinone/menaquinone biosynthesis C-methylase UbiE